MAPGAPVYFLCRSGVRSVAAAEAATAAGWARRTTSSTASRGRWTSSGRRTVAGWKIAGLPWRQG